MQRLAKAGSLFDYINGFLVVIAAVLLVFIMLSICTEVVTRYFWNRPIFWVLEVSEYNLLFITFLGAAWLLRREGHVKMDMVLNRLSTRSATLLNIITSIIGTLACLCLTWYGIEATLYAYQDGSVIPTELGPPEFLILSIIPIGGLLLFIQFMRRTSGYVLKWKESGNTE